MSTEVTLEQLLSEIEWLRHRLAEPEETIAAIRRGEVDAFVVSEGRGERVYTMRAADPPFRLMVEKMREGAATLDGSGTVLYANRRLAELLRVPADSLRGATLADFLAGDPEDLLRLLNDAGGRAELPIRCGDGSSFPGQLSVSCCAQEEISVYCVILGDMTEQKRQAATAAAQDAWREADRRKDEFLAMLGHELRTPLAAIGNAEQVLERIEPADPAVVWARELIGRQVQHLTRMVDDLLDVSRIATGKIELRRERIDLTQLASRVLEAHPILRGGDRRVSFVPAIDPVTVLADPTRIAQVLTNLLDNAAKFTGEGGAIEVRVLREGDRGTLRVADSGAGIPPEKLEAIFDPFTQLDRSRAPHAPGLGVGLTLVRKLLELHGGSVRAVSEGPGRGSEFIVSLPLAGEGAVASLEADAAAESNGPSCNVLVVEDHDDAANALAMLLRMSGHEVRIAGDGDAALEVCGSFRPDVVLLDIGLPGQDGYEVARQLREILGSEVRLIAVTGYGQEEDRRRSHEAGIDQHVLKPLRPETVEKLLRAPRPRS